MFHSRTEPVLLSGTGIIRLIFDCYYYFLGILVLTQDLLMVLSSITMISGLFLKREVFLFVLININSLLPEIDEQWYIAKLSKAAVIGISELILDDWVLFSEIQIENYDLIRSDRNRYGGGVACFIKNDLSYNTRSFLPSEIENEIIQIFYYNEILLLWVLFIVHRVKVVLLGQLLNTSLRLTQTIQKYIF